MKKLLRSTALFTVLTLALSAFALQTTTRTAASEPDAAPTGTHFDGCPHVLRIERYKTTDRYGLYFRSWQPMHVESSIEIATNGKFYAVDSPPIETDTQTDDPLAPYRSKPFAFRDAAATKSLAVLVTFKNVPDTCHAEATAFYLLVRSAPTPEATDSKAKVRGQMIDEISDVTAHELVPDPTFSLPCDSPDTDARSTHAVQPKYPPSAIAVRATGVSQIKIELDSTGSVVNAVVYKSSGNEDLDAAALSAARASTYEPETIMCVKTAGSYIFRAEFATR